MACYPQCRKWTVLTFNLIFLILGLTLLGFGTYSKIKYSDLSSVIPSSYSYFSSTPVLLIILGSVITVVSVIGSIAIFKKNSYILTAHTIILLVFCVLQIILSLVSLWVLSQDNLKENVDKKIENIYNSSNSTETIDFIQEELECCGPDGIKSLKNIRLTCYENKDPTRFPYKLGCKKAVYNFILTTIRIIGTTVLTLTPISVFGATLSQSLANAIRNQRRRYGKYLD